MRLTRPHFFSNSVTMAGLSLIVGIMICGALQGTAQEPTASLRAVAGVQTAAGVPGSRIMTLDPPTAEERLAESSLQDGKTPKNPPNGFREFGKVKAGQVSDTKRLTLRFASTAALTSIASTPDFKIEQGGSCVEGYSYAANSTCTLLVQFTPQGPGRRIGKVKVTNSVDPTPLAFGLGGEGSSPAVSFTPSIITTVPGSYVSGAGLINGASNLAVDGSDTLYIADTGNNLIRYMDSSGAFATTGSNLTAPTGIVVDSFGQIYSSEPSANAVYIIYDYTIYAYLITGAGTDDCIYNATTLCYLTQEQLFTPKAMAIDSSGQLYFTDNFYGATVYNPTNGTMVRISDGFYLESSVNGFAVDTSGNLYSGWLRPGEECQIMYQSYSNAYYLNSNATKVAGGRTCGYSGDGGQAGNAEIGATMGQIAFDIAGNLYFTDTANQRVRRIDALTGIITTIAGNGAAGYYGDNGPATAASLNTPTGVGVDSQGQVYVLSSVSATGTTQMVRKVGTVGALNLGAVAIGSSSTAQTVTVANTGNADLDYTHVGLSGGNASDFAIDGNTTSCNFTVPLASGHSCKIGFIFTPSATGNRTTTLTMTDDTVTGINTIQLSGTGDTTATLMPASFTFASTDVGATSASQTATLTNTGKAAMTISSIGFTGTNATSFTKTTTCGTTLAVGANCTIAVTFAPLTGGAPSANLTVSDNALGGQQSVALTATGVAGVLSPTSLTFPATELGSISAAQTVKLTNMAKVAIGFNSYYYPSDFPTTNNCPTSIAAGGSCTITISYKPAALGARSTSLTVDTSAGGVTVSLNGTGVAAILSPTSLTFPSTAVGSTSAAQTIKLANTASTALAFNSYSVTTDFPTTTNCPSSIAAGGSCTFTISFKPATASVRSVILTIYTSNGSVTASLNGTGVAASKTLHVALTSMANPMAANAMLMLTAEVTGSSIVRPSGSVQLMEGGRVLSQGILGNGVVTFKVAGMTTGMHLLNAVYLGDTNNKKTSSPFLRQVVGVGTVPGPVAGPVLNPPLAAVP